MIQIEVNQEKCRSPRECRKCLESCPEGVFMNYPRLGREPGKRAEDWAIVPVLTIFCTERKVCEQVCPPRAITVSVA